MQTQKTHTNQRKAERGQSLVEVAVSLPVILLLLAGTLDFGMAIFSSMILRDAAQEGALFASFNPANQAAIENRARNINPEDADDPIYSPVDLKNKDLVKVAVKIIGDDCQGATDDAANSVQVTVAYDYRMFIPFAGLVIGSDIVPLRATATNVILQPACQ
jgi:Flp pilus assembly protein TadG